MCDTLLELRDGMRRYGLAFDAGVLSVADAQRVSSWRRPSKASPPR